MPNSHTNQIIITTNAAVRDSRLPGKQRQVAELGLKAKIVVTGEADIYTVKKAFSATELKKVVEILHNPVSQSAFVNDAKTAFKETKFTWVIEIGFLPGVTDNVATTIKDSLADLLHTPLKADEGVWTSQLIFVDGQLTEKDAQVIGRCFANPLIQRIAVKSAAQFQKDGGMEVVVPEVKLQATGKVKNVDLTAKKVDDDELVKIGKQGVANADGTRRGPLALDLSQMKSIQTYFEKLGREPADIELESIAQTWSEHCKHTIFANPIDELKDGLFKTYIRGATEKIRKQKGKKDICASVFTDNSGGIFFDDEYVVTDKVETHNSPSALDPFGGAVTGIVGVNRDALGFGLGAKPILNRYGFCFGLPDDKTQLYRDKNQTQPMLSPRRIMDGVIEGVNSGGNCSGIPSPQGFVYFDKRFAGKPLVFVGTIGLIPRKQKNENTGKTVNLLEKAAQPGDFVVVAGGRVGLDGIHGATFSSESLSSGSPATAVQIGDPITQKKLSDVIVKEARDLNLYHSITDNGAGGLSCSVAEMAKESGGFEVELEKVPLKYPGLEPWQIWISESQERMTFAVSPKNWSAFEKLLKKRGVEATVIGKFTNSGECVVTYHGKKIMDMSMDFLHDGLPKKQLKTEYVSSESQDPKLEKNMDFAATGLKLLARPSIASTAFISQQYDHEVQATSVLKPLQGKGRVNAETTVIRPRPESFKGVAVSQALYPSFAELDPAAMAAAAIDSAIRSLVAVGADLNAIALLDNFCWCSSNDPLRLGQLKLTAEACYEYAVAFQTPYISGKDSMFNDFNGFDAQGKNVKISIPPTVLISSLAVVDDVRKMVSLDAKTAGDLVYVLGETNDELGGSEFFRLLADEEKSENFGSKVPQVSAKKNAELYKKYSECVQKNLVASAQSVGRGGLFTAVAKMSLGGQLGMDLSLKKLAGNWSTDSAALFSESQGRILVTVSPRNQKKFEQFLKGCAVSLIGEVSEEKSVQMKNEKGVEVLNMSLAEMQKAYTSTFAENAALTQPSQSSQSAKTSQKPQALVLTGYGINCEEETAHAFEISGAETTIVHINDLIDQPSLLKKAEILAIPGGFSFGDDTGSGNAFAQKLKNSLWSELAQFVEKDHLVIGICNGCQILTNLGLFPTHDQKYGTREVALLHNDSNIYSDRWVDICVESETPWLKNLTTFSLPIAHGEGKFFATPVVLEQLESNDQVAARYVPGEVCQHFQLPTNPNGSAHKIAAITDPSGRVFGIMPHPERAMFFTQLPHWTFLKEEYLRAGKELPEFAPGLQIFQNAVHYFKG